MGGDLPPSAALVWAHPDLTARSPQIKPQGLATVGAERLPLDREPGLFRGKAAILAFPTRAAIAGAVDGGPSARAGPRPHCGSVHGKDPGGVGVARMWNDRKSDVSNFRRH